MKVICIDSTKDAHPESIGNFIPKEGSVYTVTETVHWYGYDWYLLKEDEGGNGWNPIYFIPLSKTNNKTLKYESERV